MPNIPQNLSLQDLEDLQADIKVYKDLDRSKTEQIFWEALEVVCEDQIKQNKKKIKVSWVQWIKALKTFKKL